MSSFHLDVWHLVSPVTINHKSGKIWNLNFTDESYPTVGYLHRCPGCAPLLGVPLYPQPPTPLTVLLWISMWLSTQSSSFKTCSVCGTVIGNVTKLPLSLHVGWTKVPEYALGRANINCVLCIYNTRGVTEIYPEVWHESQHPRVIVYYTVHCSGVYGTHQYVSWQKFILTCPCVYYIV